MKVHTVNLPTPMNISIWWNFGSILGLVLFVQLITGVFLAIHYISGAEAFCSVNHIMRDVNRGWLIRYLHANGASFFFLRIYSHISRGIFYGSYIYKGVWFSGVILVILVISSAFLGYVLPWGQIRYWGATVITNIFSAFPYIGRHIVYWLWGGFSVTGVTLTRFFTLHFILPLLVCAFVVFHIILLHRTGSNNPLGLNSSADKIPFHPYFTIKDIVGFVVLFLLLISLAIFQPFLLGEPDNFIEADPLVTPSHITPEWYFLFAYAILRSIPNKLGGVVGLFASLLILLSLPYLGKSKIKGKAFDPWSKLIFWVFVLSFSFLTVAGAWPVEPPYVNIRRLFAMLYFVSFLSYPFIRPVYNYVSFRNYV